MGARLICPHCGQTTDRFDQPRMTVDAAVFNERGELLLIQRGHPPEGWALPGGFVDVGETLEAAVARELREETALVATGQTQFHTYSAPDRDPRHHTVCTVFLVQATGNPVAGDDAAQAAFFSPRSLPRPMAFDHAEIVGDLVRFRTEGHRPGER